MKGQIMDNKNQNGMRYPSIDDLLGVIDSKYKLAIVASKVAKMIDSHPKLNLTSLKCKKSVGQALEEIINRQVKVEFSRDKY